MKQNKDNTHTTSQHKDNTHTTSISRFLRRGKRIECFVSGFVILYTSPSESSFVSAVTSFFSGFEDAKRDLRKISGI